MSLLIGAGLILVGGLAAGVPLFDLLGGLAVSSGSLQTGAIGAFLILLGALLISAWVRSFTTAPRK